MIKRLAALLVLFAIVCAAALPVRAQFADQATDAGTSTGAANAQILTMPNVAAYADVQGVLIKFTPGFSNTTAATIAINGLTPQPVLLASVGTIPLPPSSIVVGQKAFVLYDGTEFILIPPRGPTQIGFAGLFGDSGGSNKLGAWTI